MGWVYTLLLVNLLPETLPEPYHSTNQRAKKSASHSHTRSLYIDYWGNLNLSIINFNPCRNVKIHFFPPNVKTLVWSTLLTKIHYWMHLTPLSVIVVKLHLPTATIITCVYHWSTQPPDLANVYEIKAEVVATCDWTRKTKNKIT